MDINDILADLGLDLSNPEVKRGALEAIDAILTSRMPPMSLGGGAAGGASGSMDVEIDPDLLQPSKKHQPEASSDDIEIEDEEQRVRQERARKEREAREAAERARLERLRIEKERKARKKAAAIMFGTTAADVTCSIIDVFISGFFLLMELCLLIAHTAAFSLPSIMFTLVATILSTPGFIIKLILKNNGISKLLLNILFFVRYILIFIIICISFLVNPYFMSAQPAYEGHTYISEDKLEQIVINSSEIRIENKEENNVYKYAHKKAVKTSPVRLRLFDKHNVEVFDISDCNKAIWYVEYNYRIFQIQTFP